MPNTNFIISFKQNQHKTKEDVVQMYNVNASHSLDGKEVHISVIKITH